MPASAQALSTAVECWNAGDLDGYLRLYDDAIRLHGYSPEPMGKEEVRGFYAAILAGLDRPQLDFHEVLWDGESCAIRNTLSGRHVGEFLGVHGTGTEVKLPGITILHFSGGKVVERWSQADMLGFLVQVGAVPAPA